MRMTLQMWIHMQMWTHMPMNAHVNEEQNGKLCSALWCFHMSGCKCECKCEAGKWIAPLTDQCECKCECNRITMNFEFASQIWRKKDIPPAIFTFTVAYHICPTWKLSFTRLDLIIIHPFRPCWLVVRTILRGTWEREKKTRADKGRGGMTTSGNGRAWSLANPRGRWRPMIKWRKQVAKSCMDPRG